MSDSKWVRGDYFDAAARSLGELAGFLAEQETERKQQAERIAQLEALLIENEGIGKYKAKLDMVVWQANKGRIAQLEAQVRRLRVALEDVRDNVAMINATNDDLDRGAKVRALGFIENALATDGDAGKGDKQP